MRKFLENFKEIIIKNKIISIIIGILLIGIILLIIFSRTSVDSVKFVSKILPNKYYKIECMSDRCDYIIAYKGDKLGKSKMSIYNAKGKKIASYKETFLSDSKSIRNIVAVNEKYIIFENRDLTDNKVKGYTIATTKGKEIYKTDNVLTSLNNYLISEKLEESFNVLNKNGKAVLKNVENIKTYADGKYFSMTVKKENVIINEKGESILNGYKVAKQVSDENDEVIYLVLQDINKSSYYYFNVSNNKIVGDTFNSYMDGSNTGELIITKKINNEYVKYILKQNGKTEKLSKVDLSKLSNIDSKYSVITESYIIPTQKVILVKNNSDNSFGTYNLEKKEYNKLISYSDNNGTSSLSKLLSNESDLYIQIACTKGNCEDNKLVIYDMVNDKKLYDITNSDYGIRYFTNYGDYNVVRYSSESNDEYKNKYAVYDKNNKEIYRSDEQIVIIDKEYKFGKEALSYSLILFSAKDNKAINNTDSLATKVTLGKSYLYKYSDGNKTYIYGSDGDKLKAVNNSKVSLIYSNDTLMYIQNSRVYIINPVDNRTTSYKLRLNERINAADGENMPPYKNALYINNTISNYGKVTNVNGRTIRKIRNSLIESVDYNKDTKRVIIITKKTKKNNNYYGLYIAK
jgi:hypothetical protein